MIGNARRRFNVIALHRLVHVEQLARRDPPRRRQPCTGGPPCHPNPRTYLPGSIELIQAAGFNGFYELGEAVVECAEEHISRERATRGAGSRVPCKSFYSNLYSTASAFPNKIRRIGKLGAPSLANLQLAAYGDQVPLHLCTRRLGITSTQHG